MSDLVLPAPSRGRLARAVDALRPWWPRGVTVDDPVDAQLAQWLTPQRYVAMGMAVILVVFGGLVVWHFTSEFERGSVGDGVVQPASYRKVISSRFGAVVREIHVSENQHVEAGEPLLVLDATESDVNARVMERKHWAERARIARLTAIREGSESITFPQDLLDVAAKDLEIADTVQAARTAFDSSRLSLTERLAQFRSQQLQADESLAGQRAQRVQLGVQGALITKELDGVQFLMKQGLERKPHLLELQRTQAQLEASFAGVDAAIARLQVQHNELEVRIQSMIADDRDAASKELNTAWNNDLEYVDRIKYWRDMASLTVLRAPQSGTVLSLKARTVGAAIRADEPLVELVPDEDALMLRVVVHPQNINDVVPGTPARVSIQNGGHGLRRLDARVVNVSPDLVPHPRMPAGTYVADVEIVPGALTPQARKRLLPGMQASVKLITGHVSVWTYMTEELLDALHGHRLLMEDNERAAQQQQQAPQEPRP